MAGTSPWAFTVEHTLLTLCSENELTTWSFADNLRSELLLGLEFSPRFWELHLLIKRLQLWHTNLHI